jgi:hypothetical protein
MRLPQLLLLLTFSACHLFASAISFPSSPAPYADTTFVSVSKPATNLETHKTGLFQKLKNKVLGFFVKSELRKEKTMDAKSVWGYIALGLLIGGIGLFILGGGSIGLVMLLGSLIATVVALAKNSDKGQPVEVENKEKRKKRGRLIVAILAGGGLVALLIGLSTWRMH